MQSCLESKIKPFMFLTIRHLDLLSRFLNTFSSEQYITAYRYFNKISENVLKLIKTIEPSYIEARIKANSFDSRIKNKANSRSKGL